MNAAAEEIRAVEAREHELLLRKAALEEAGQE
jgi:hypothetical protein